MCAADFFGIYEKASVTDFMDIILFACRMDEEWLGM
jgi:hypothetical protein